MIEMNVHIERIGNGYIVTDNECPEKKIFYSSLVKFVEANVVTVAREQDEHDTSHDCIGRKIHIVATTKNDDE